MRGEVDAGHPLVRVFCRRAVTRKVLVDGRDAAGLEAARERDAEGGDARGVVAERARSDDGARRRIREVEHGSEVDRDAGGPQVGRRERADARRERGVAARAERHHRRYLVRARAQARDATALLVDRDERARAGRVLYRRRDVVDEGARLRDVAGIAIEQDNAARSELAQAIERNVVRARSVESDAQHRSRAPLQHTVLRHVTTRARSRGSFLNAGG